MYLRSPGDPEGPGGPGGPGGPAGPVAPPTTCERMTVIRYFLFLQKILDIFEIAVMHYRCIHSNMD